MRKMPTLPGTPADDAAPFLDDVADEVLQKDLEDARVRMDELEVTCRMKVCHARRF